MTGSVFVDVCRFFPTAGGTTDWTFSSAVIGYQSPASAGIVNSLLYSYRAESADLTQWEIGQGAYNTATGVLARTTVLYNSSATGTGSGQSGAGTKINFSTIPQVAVVALNEDLLTANVTKAIQQTGTNNVAGVTPLHQQDHDSAAKAWVNFVGATGIINASYNVTNVTRSAAGIYVVNFTTAFTNTNYVAVGMSNSLAINGWIELNSATTTASACGLFAINTIGGAVFDPVSVLAVFYGRQ